MSGHSMTFEEALDTAREMSAAHHAVFSVQMRPGSQVGIGDNDEARYEITCITDLGFQYVVRSKHWRQSVNGQRCSMGRTRRNRS